MLKLKLNFPEFLKLVQNCNFEMNFPNFLSSKKQKKSAGNNEIRSFSPKGAGTLGIPNNQFCQSPLHAQNFCKITLYLRF